MRQTILFLLVTLSAGFILSAQPVQKGPYTVSVLADGVFHIEDSNDSNPAGVHLDANNQYKGMNNCSDMYLVVGDDKALLIDLSNAVKWDPIATESLRSMVYERVGNRQLYITITHKHGDHLGMLPAYINDTKVRFWIPKEEFRGMNIFPEGRTNYFKENESMDLGSGYIIKTVEVSGHTEHSTIFFLNGKNLVFTGDAIGSGSGVWLFNYESFPAYKNAIDKLITYIENPANGVDAQKLVIYGGHNWQSKQIGKLTMQYIYDMKTLIERIGEGTAETVPMSAAIPFLDTNFKYGTATITWNKEAASKYGLNKENCLFFKPSK